MPVHRVLDHLDMTPWLPDTVAAAPDRPANSMTDPIFVFFIFTILPGGMNMGLMDRDYMHERHRQRTRGSSNANAKFDRKRIEYDPRQFRRDRTAPQLSRNADRPPVNRNLRYLLIWLAFFYILYAVIKRFLHV